MNQNLGDTRSSHSSRRLSSNNPFRQSEAAAASSSSSSRSRGVSSQLSNSAFEQWVEKNKALIEESDEERDQVYERPSFPTSSRTGSDSDVNYGRYVSSFEERQRKLINRTAEHPCFIFPFSILLIFCSIHDSIISSQSLVGTSS